MTQETVIIDTIRPETVMTTGQVTVTTGNILIKAANIGRKQLLIQNTGSVDIWVGNTGITATTGFKLPAGASYNEDKDTSAFYGTTASGTSVIAFKETV